MVIGLHHDQEFFVKKRYKEYKIRFIHTDCNVKSLNSCKNNFDYIFVMKKFIAHRITAEVNFHNHDGFVFIHGGLSELFRNIDERINHEYRN